MAEVKKKSRHISTNIDFEFSSPVLKAILCSLLILLLLTIAIYQIYAHTKTQKSLPTETALSTTVFRSVTADAVALRHETVLSQNSAGTVVPMVANGSKVAVNDAVARIFSSAADAQQASAYAQLEEEIAYYENIAALSTGNLVAGLDLYNNNVTDRLLALQNCVTRGKLDSFSDHVTELSESITKKQIAVGGSVDVSSKLQSLYAAMDGLSSSGGSYSSVNAPAAGYYVNTVDGFEDLYDMSDVRSLTGEQAAALLEAAPVNTGACVGKLITEFNWYLVCVTDDPAVDMLEVGSNVKIAVDELGGEVLTMRLKAKNPGEGVGTTLVFASNIMNSEVASLRFSQIRIRVEEYKGFAVNRKAVRTIDGEVGVFIQLGNMVRFRKINIIYSDDNVIIAEESSEDGFLRLYDEVITEGVDYDDGKVIV